MIGRPPGTKLIKTGEELISMFNEYEIECKSKPYKVQDFVGKEGREVFRDKERSLTMEGFEVYAHKTIGIWRLIEYFMNKDGRYEDYIDACRIIRLRIREDQIGGGMAGVYNHNITARLNGLVDKSQQTIIEQPLFPDVKPTDVQSNDSDQ